MKYQRFFILYPTCVLAKGKCNASINDLQRSDVYRIPLSLYDLFEKDNIIDLEALFNNIDWDEDDKICLEEYIEFLLDNELGIVSSQRDLFSPLPTKYSNPNIISNCIIDFDQNSNHPLSYICEQLNNLRCEALELRYYSSFPFDRIISDLICFKDSTLRSIAILLIGNNSKEADDKLITDLLNANPRISDITFHSSPFDDIKILGTVLPISYTSQIITDESFCGCFSKSYIFAQTQLYIESLHFNNCLHKKLSVDRLGQIKNCPSMKESFGFINDFPDLRKLVNSVQFQKLWKIKKDNISICQDCEFRYSCQDCRAYLIDPNNLYSKPLKCKYAP